MHTLKHLLIVCLCLAAGGAEAADFASRWSETVDRVWVGPEYWANRLQDWRIHDGQLECTATSRQLAMRTVHLLTHRLSKADGSFVTMVRVRALPPVANAQDANADRGPSDAAAGFLVGVGDPETDYRAAAIVHQWPGKGGGIFAGLDREGRAFIRDNTIAESKTGELIVVSPTTTDASDILLRLMAQPGDQGRYALSLEAVDPATGDVKTRVVTSVPADRLVGNVALVSHPGKGGTGYAFREWKLGGDKVLADPQATMGPIACTQHTLSRGILKMTVQLMPVGVEDPVDVSLQTRQDDRWQTIARADIIRPGYTATFRVPKWDDGRNVPYRVIYGAPTNPRLTPGWAWTGTVRKDPVDKDVIVVAGFTGNHNNAHGMRIGGHRDWARGMWFPHADLTQRVVKQTPDLLFFSGDQVYEGDSPTFADTANIQLDYLYKWYLWCWAYRDLTKDLPCICIPDDHDVYQGNLWGQGGRKSPGRDHDGGYVHPAEFVKMVERTQTSHLPDPFDPTPVEQGIGTYYTGMTYGRISIAILEDRKFKSGCARPDMPPSKTGRPDHFNDPDLDPRKLDIDGVTLLGPRQLNFLETWAKDWRGADMKMAVSQTVFANVATHHGGGLDRLRADLDSNGWPQTGRNKAIRALSKGFAFHLCGDQHLATLVHHGVERQGDGIWSFCVPSIANFYPRAYAPENRGKYQRPAAEEFTGYRRDGLGNLITVFAATNPGKDMGHDPRELHNGMPGYGIVRLNKAQRTITMECWPRFANPADPQHAQYEGWPKTIRQRDNYGRRAHGYLPTFQVVGMADPVVQVIDEASGETVYTLRIRGNRFRPKVFAEGTYTVRIGEQEPERLQEFTGLKPVAREQQRREIEVQF